MSLLRALTLCITTVGLALSVDAQKPRKKTTRRPAAKTTTRATTLRTGAAARTRATVARPRGRARVARPAAPALAKLEARTPFGLDGLRADLGTLAASSIRSGSWGMMVTSITHGDTLFAINADVPHVPASTQKMLTTVLALDALGPQYRFRTEVLHTGELRDGRVTGDLILRGDGDPSMSTRFLRTFRRCRDGLVGAACRRGRCARSHRPRDR
ncbi:MAG: D-alanyl-D-alanine carboxypeptidase [Gemmatimonadaceae bacterium]|nr:D-alanyl-D-alanine carboxypeptidase [Gemmatimonadaceae bacterium]